MRLRFADATNKLVEEGIIEQLQDKEIIVFGAGKSGEFVVRMLREYNIEPCCFCDNYELKWGTSREGLKIISFEEAIKTYPNAFICVASMWQEEIFKQIKEYDKNLFQRTFDLLTSMAWETCEFKYESSEVEYIKKNISEFQQLHEMLADDQSKKTLCGILNYRITRKQSYLKKIKSNEVSYLDRTVLSDETREGIRNSAIIDGGAFDGDTMELIINNLGEDSLEIHCYEPDEKSVAVLENKIKNYNTVKVVIHKAALWNKTGYVQFSANGLSGACVDVENENTEKVTAEAIDDYEYRKVGLIKLDVEGAELQALEGARKTIERDKPILSISAYHLQDDLLVLSKWVKSLNAKYKLYLRHYMYSAGETILYGIPE